MKQKTRQKLRLMINLVLTVFTLFALIISVIAWFSTRQYAQISSINLSVNRQTVTILKRPQSFLFPCATKINDVRESDFNTFCFVTGTYVIQGEGKLFVDVTSDDGVLGYVLEGDETEGYFQAITDDLKKELGENYANAEYDVLKDALHKINLSRAVGTTVTDENGDKNTEITIVCWADYSKLGDDISVAEYLQKSLSVDVTFIS